MKSVQAGFRILNRFDFQRIFARGTVLNIGVYDDPAKLWRDFGAVNLDINDLSPWYPERFVHAKAERITQFFKAKSFDTAILGDVLEHVEDPFGLLMKSLFVAHRVVITVPSKEHDVRYGEAKQERKDNPLMMDHIQQFEEKDIEEMLGKCGAFIRYFAYADIPNWCGWMIVLESQESLMI